MMPGELVRQYEAARAMLRRGTGGVHLVGICGIGMAGVAFLLKQRGFHVTGCDPQTGRMGPWLAAHGIDVLPGHDPAHLEEGVDWLITTPAVCAAQPELRYAARRSIPRLTRGAVLPALLAQRAGVAVAGTHGKTTTALFIATLLAEAGRDPSWCIGGESSLLGGVAGIGGGAEMVAEADESDGTLALYEAEVAVVTNIEYDHMEHFEGMEAFEGCFRHFISRARRRVVFCRDDPRARALCEGLPLALSYGLSEGSDVRAIHVREGADASRFELRRGGASRGEILLPVPGRHNVLNALAAIATAHALGLGPDDLRRGLSRLALPRRRFEIVARHKGVVVVSDYAHHPSEIRALVKTAARWDARRRIVLFQPHRYTRTRALGSDFPEAFQGVDEVILLPVYAASEAPLAGGTTWDLYRCFREQGRSARVAWGLEDAWAYVRRIVRAGDLLLVAGAGDIVKIADWARDLEDAPAAWDAVRARDALAAQLTATELSVDEPLAPKTRLRVGGHADLWARVGRLDDLVVLRRWAARENVPVTLLGQGCNTVFGGLGMRGITIQLGGEFRQVRRDADIVVAGAGLSGRALLDALQAAGRAGLEFLEGIPGTVGGLLCMNAGAWGKSILDHISWIRCLNPDGGLCIVPRKELKYGYRECETLAGAVVVDAGFALSPGVPDEMGAARALLAEKRTWMKGLRCAGSVFKNPPGDTAGRLLDAAGMKAARVGGARVSERHANLIVTEPGATAEDVLALMEWMRQKVKTAYDIELEPEVSLPGRETRRHVV